MSEIQVIDIYNPDREQILYAVEILKKGGVIVYPTDTIYGLGADISNKEAINRIFKIKKISSQKLLSFICSDIKEASNWAQIPTQAFRIMNRVLPGQYTFILPISKNSPKSISQKRKTIGIRIPDSIIARKIVNELGRPMLTSSVPCGPDEFAIDPREIARDFPHDVKLILDAGIIPNIPSTVVDFTTPQPVIIREGAGDIQKLYG